MLPWPLWRSLLAVLSSLRVHLRVRRTLEWQPLTSETRGHKASFTWAIFKNRFLVVGHLIYVLVARALHISHYTNTYFLIFFFRWEESRLTDLYVHLPIGEEARSFSSGCHEGANSTDKLLIFFFFASGGFSVWSGGMAARVSCPPHSVPVYSQGRFSLKAKWSGYVGRFPAFRELRCTPSLGQHRVYAPVRKDTQVNLPGQCGNSSVLCTERSRSQI